MNFLKNSLKFIAASVIISISASINADAQQPVKVDSINPVTDSVAAVVSDVTIEQTAVETPVEQAINEPMRIKRINLTQVLGILVPFVSVIIILWLILHFRNERERDRLRVIEKSIEKGCPLPPEFYYRAGKNKSIATLQSGICWIGAGLAIIVFFGKTANEVAPLGILPFFVGIAKLATYLVLSRRQKESEKYNIPLPKLPRNDQQD